MTGGRSLVPRSSPQEVVVWLDAEPAVSTRQPHGHRDGLDCREDRERGPGEHKAISLTSSGSASQVSTSTVKVTAR